MADHEIYMRFQARGPLLSGMEKWAVNFLERDLVTPIGRERYFGSRDKVIQLIQRTRTPLTLAVRQALDVGLSVGRGGITLDITDEQYRKLKG